MSKLSVHLTDPGNRTGYGDFLRIPNEHGNPVSIVYQLNANTKADVNKYSPTTKLVYRRQSEKWQRLPGNFFEGNPIQSCKDWMLNTYENGKNLINIWNLNPADWYDALNEPVPQTVLQAKWLNTWMLTALDIANSYGLKLSLFSFSVGRPEYDLWEYLLDSLYFGKESGAILSLHQYGVNDPLITYDADGEFTKNTIHCSLRHRKVYELLPENCRLPTIISEGGAGNGFGTGINGKEFLEDAIRFDREIMKDKYVLGANLFQLGGNESNLVEILPDLTRYISVTPNTVPDEEPPIPVEELPYVVIAHLAPQNATLEQMNKVQNKAFEYKSTVCQSADDARFLVQHGKPGSKAVIYNPESYPGGTQGILNYFSGCSVDIDYLEDEVPPPISFPVRTGVSAGNRCILTSQEINAIKLSKVDSFLALTMPSSEESQIVVNQLRTISPNMFIIGRLFFSADFVSKTLFNASSFCAYCKNGLDGLYAKGVRYFQIHNEPNLEQEGMNWNWANGKEFGGWLIQVLTLLKIRYPEAKWGYPGLSPQPNTEQFWADSQYAMNMCDWVGVHSYWQYRGTTGWGMESLDGGFHYKRLKTSKPLMITEFSNNSPKVDYVTKGLEIKDYYRLTGIPAFCFALSWDNDPNLEGWVHSGNLTKIPETVGS